MLTDLHGGASGGQRDAIAALAGYAAAIAKRFEEI
jgi:hypothetical protein